MGPVNFSVQARSSIQGCYWDSCRVQQARCCWRTTPIRMFNPYTIHSILLTCEQTVRWYWKQGVLCCHVVCMLWSYPIGCHYGNILASSSSWLHNGRFVRDEFGVMLIQGSLLWSMQCGINQTELLLLRKIMQSGRRRKWSRNKRMILPRS